MNCPEEVISPSARQIHCSVLLCYREIKGGLIFFDAEVKGLKVRARIQLCEGCYRKLNEDKG